MNTIGEPSGNVCVKFSILFFLPLFLFCCLVTSYSQKKFQVYYLSIGSEHYIPPLSPNNTSKIENVDAASTSAKVMAEIFSKYSSGKGVTFTSSKKSLFSPEVFERELEKVWEIMEKDDPKNPLLIIYYCGHGYTENLTNQQFLLSGDCSKLKAKEDFDSLCIRDLFIPFIVRSIGYETLKHNKYIKTYIDSFLTRILPLPTIFEIIEAVTLKGGIIKDAPSYMLILDCCREKIQNDSLDIKKLKEKYGIYAPYVEAIFNEAQKKTLKDLDSIRQYSDHIIYTSKYAREVSTEYVPSLKLSLNSLKDVITVGPVCRRVLMYLNEQRKNSLTKIALRNFVSGITKVKKGEDLFTPYCPDTNSQPDSTIFLEIK